MEKESEEFEIKALNLGVKGSRAERDLLRQKYAKNAKIVKLNKKISPKLKRQILKNYGIFVEDN